MYIYKDSAKNAWRTRVRWRNSLFNGYTRNPNAPYSKLVGITAFTCDKRNMLFAINRIAPRYRDSASLAAANRLNMVLQIFTMSLLRS